MKWTVLCAALAASTCLWLAPVSGDSEGGLIHCGFSSPKRAFPKTPITLASGLTKEAAIAAAEDDAWIGDALGDFYKWEWRDRCGGCETHEGHPKPVGFPCSALFTFEPGEDEEDGVEVEVIENLADGTFSVVVTIVGEALGWIDCLNDC
ncbi:MAG: hypothetical protein GC161_11105 [Planctomycetaceae bacterium]|nr:hypothetical protein [Planctomycetaceae bacterium]